MDIVFLSPELPSRPIVIHQKLRGGGGGVGGVDQNGFTLGPFETSNLTSSNPLYVWRSPSTYIMMYNLVSA